MSFVVAPSNELLLHFRDDRNKHATVKMYIAASETNPAGGHAASISTAAAALSDAALYETEILIIAEQNTAPTFGTSPYDRPSDKAQYEFSTADGSIIHMQIPAPLATQFSDSWAVDPADSLVTTFVSAMRSNAVNQEGNAILALLPSHRRRPPRRKVQ
jgi:hypothetical protein